MKGAKSFMEKQDIIPFISFKVNEPRHLILIDSKEDKIKDKRSGNMVDGVKFLVTEDGDQKSFFTTSFVLIQKLSEIDENSKVTVMQVKYKADDGDFKTSYEVEEGFIEMGKKKGASESGEEYDSETESLEEAAQSSPNW